MIQKNIVTKQKQTQNFETKLMVIKGETLGGGMDWEVGIDIYTLLHTKLLSNKDLLYSWGKYIQYSVIAYMGK